jgi:hypothetical protein
MEYPELVEAIIAEALADAGARKDAKAPKDRAP